MIYWIIPYLVAYNASNSGDWKYGPEHVFKAVVEDSSLHPIHGSRAFVTANIEFVCKPMESSLMQCRIDSAMMDRYEVMKGSDLKQYSAKDEEFGLDHVVFQIKYDEEGISRVWFLNNNDSYIHDMIRAVIGTTNMGMSIAKKTVGHYVSREKSMIGTCDTSFVINNELLSQVDKDHETNIEGYEFYVPAFGPRTDDKTIVIEKDRHPSECIKKTPYFFGSTDPTDVEDQKLKLSIKSSQSRFNLGKKSFSAHTDNSAMIVGPSRKKSGPPIKISVNEEIHVTLQSIRPAKNEQWNTENLVNAGVGFEPGSSWPGRQMEQ